MSTGLVRRSWRNSILVFLLSTLLVLALYGDILQGWWCGDDPQILKHALSYSPWEYFTVPAAWRALIPYSLTPWLTFTYDIDQMLFGFNPIGYYAHNLLIIVLCACLVHQIARQWVDDLYAAGAAVFFLVGSPVMAASQQLMVRHYVEGLFFYLLALLLIIRALRKGADRTVWLAGFAFAIAATAKELYLPLGFIPFLLPMGSLKQRLKTAWPMLLVMLLYVPWRWYMLGDVIGGYTPSGDFKWGDLMAIGHQFAIIPGLVFFTQPWFGVTVFGIVICLILIWHYADKRVLALLFILPVLLFMPLIPLVRYPGLGASSERYFIAIWTTIVLTAVLVLGSLVKGRAAWFRLCTFMVAILLGISVWSKTRQVLFHIRSNSQEQYVQGRALVTSDSHDILYLTPVVPSWYIKGLLDLRKQMGQPSPPPFVVADELNLSETPVTGRRLLRYEQAKKAMVDCTSQVPEMLLDWRKKVRPAPLTAAVEFDAATKVIRWLLGPYEKGTYTYLSDMGQQQITSRGVLRMEKKPEGSLRFRYDSPEGWIAYTPSLHLVSDGGRRYGVAWSGTETVGIRGEGVEVK